MTEKLDVYVGDMPSDLVAHWGWIVALGLCLAIVGALAIYRSRTATVAYVSFLGILLLITAALLLIFAVAFTGNWSGFFIHTLWAVLFGVIGFMMVSRPVLSAEAITLVMAFNFIVTGLIGIFVPLFSNMQGWGYYLLEGLVTTVLGVLLFSGWPITGLWAIGLFIGIDLLFRGLGLIALGMSLPSIIK